MKLLTSIIAAATSLMLTACTSNKQEAADESKPKTLILYYSQTGATKTVAEELQKQTGADIEEITLETPYGGTFEETIQRVQQERAEETLPALKPLKSSIDNYDVIFLGFPIWFGTYAPPITSLLTEYYLDGKNIVPFCTFGSGGLEASAKDLKAALPNATIAEGYGVRNARVGAAATELTRFLIENKYIDGEIDPLPDFSEQAPVTDDEAKIFDAACSNYQFPLGTPSTVGKRDIADGTEYKFTVNSQSPDGTTVETIIYVIQPTDEGAVPEFTRVVR